MTIHLVRDLEYGPVGPIRDDEDVAAGAEPAEEREVDYLMVLSLQCQ